MPQEDLIYRITKAVFSRLGDKADARVVEDLVTDIYRLIEAGGTLDGVGAPQSEAARVVVSAFGTSRPGIVAAITSALAEASYDIVDMNQTVVQGKFAMVLIAEGGDGTNDLTSLRERLKIAGERIGVRVYAQREELFQSMHRV
jgi:ACT domain-containing protein